MNSENCAVILAAGEGKRMKSAKPKALAEVLFKPMIDWVSDSVLESGVNDICVVTGHLSELLCEHLSSDFSTVLQNERLGTGHAVAQAKEFIAAHVGANVLVLNGDAPFIDTETINGALEQHIKTGCAATVVSAMVEDPFGYGRMIRDANGGLLKIVEQRDCTAEQAAVSEVNSGAYWFDCSSLLDALETLSETGGSKAEYYLTDVIEILLSKGKPAMVFTASTPDVILGANDRRQLAQLNAIARRRELDRLLDGGVSIPFEDGVIVSPESVVGADTVLLPGTILKGKVSIGCSCIIGPNSLIENSTFGDKVTFNSSQSTDACVLSGASIGPFSRLRPGAQVGERVKIGNFVEIKNSVIGAETSLSHLTYIGDSDVGSGVNVGCGCATANYSGTEKHRSVIGNDAFIGCDTCLVSPVKIGNGAYTAAGSVITSDVPDGALAIAREKQTVREGWAYQKQAYKRKK